MFNKFHDTWWKISISVCIFGFLKELKPSDPFIYEFLIGKWRNLTEDQVNQDVYPVVSYSFLASLILIFLITDLCRYKPLLIVLGCCGIIIWSMLLWTKSLIELQILEAIYGIYLAADVAYLTYMYAKVPQEYYQQVTSHARAAILAGRCVAGILAQILISFELLDYRGLNYISFSAQVAATLWSLTIPSVSTSVYFNQESLDKLNLTFKTKSKHAFKLMWKHFITSYSKPHVLKWSIWWSLATCIFIHIQSYMQPLWSVILKSDNADIYNGAIEALSMLLSVLGTLLAGALKTNWEPLRELILTFSSVVIGGILILTSQTNSIFISYGCYILFNIIYQYMVTVASSEISKHILPDTYGLVFGLNTFIALALQNILTIIVVNGDIGYGMNPRNQFIVYGGYFFVIAVIYFSIGFLSFVQTSKKRTANHV